METADRKPVAQLNINNHKYPVYEGVNTIGRNRNAVVNVIHLNISQNHAIIITTQDQHYISDLKSSNGTYVNDTKLVPLKLHPLSHNARVTLGTLSGIYIAEGDFSNISYSNLSLATQSFFDKNTELFEATQDVDIHEAQTQEINWSNFKTRVKLRELPPLPKASFDIPVAEKHDEQPSISLTLPDIDQYNDENLPFLANTESFPEPCDVELTDAEKFSKPALHEELTEAVPLERPSRPVFTDDNDDELTDCELDIEPDNLKLPRQSPTGENSNDSLKFLNLAKATTEVQEEPDNSKIIDSDNSDTEIISGEDWKKSTNQDLSDQEDSDHPVAKRGARKSSRVILTQDLPSPDEIETYSKQEELLVNESGSETEEYNPCKKANDSNIFNFTIPETQNQNISNLDNQNVSSLDNQNGSKFDDSDCIPATPNVHVSTRESQRAEKHSQLSEENFKLGLTQMLESSEMSCLGDEEDSFLAPTQKIIPSRFELKLSKIQENQNKNVDVKSVRVEVPETSEVAKDISEIPTENNIHLATSGSQDEQEGCLATCKEGAFETSNQSKTRFNLGTSTAPSRLSDAEELPQDIFEASTQKVFSSTTNEENIYDALTQKVPQPQYGEAEENIFNRTTQTIVKRVMFNSPSQSLVKKDSGAVAQKNTPDIFQAPTQKVSLNSLESQNNNDVYDALTQKVVQYKKDDIFGVANQKLAEDVSKSSLQLSITQKDTAGISVTPIETLPFCMLKRPIEDDFYGAATQRSTKDDSETACWNMKVSKTQTTNMNEEDEVFDAPTQKVAQELFNKNSQKELSRVCELRTEERVDESTLEIIFAASNQKEPASPRNAPLQEQADFHDIPSQQTTCEFPKDSATIGELAEENNLADGKKALDVPHQEPVTKNEEQNKSASVLTTSPKCNLSILTSTAIEEQFVEPKAKTNDFSEPVNKKTRKAFSFKKTSCNLDISLSTLTNNKNQTSPTPSNQIPGSSSTSLSCIGGTNESTLNGSSFESNKSLALIEAKLTKTRKSCQTAKIEVSVPKNRSSMGIVKAEVPPVEEEDIPPKSKRGRKLSNRSDTKSLRSGKVKVEETEDSQSSKDFSKKTEVKLKTRSSRSEDKLTQVKQRKAKAESKLSKVEEDESESIRQVNKRAKLSKEHIEVSGPSSSRQELPTSSGKELSASSSTIKSEPEDNTRARSKAKGVGKRKKNVVEEDVKGVFVKEECPSPLKRRRIQSDDSALSTPQRGLRKQRPKVVFTMMESPQMESLVKQLGGSMVNSVEACSLLITEQVKRSQKLLAAVGLGKPICSPRWITESKKNHEFLDPWDFILSDPEAERKWEFSLKESLNRGREKKLLETYNFHIQVSSGVDVLKGAIESCGGKILTKIPSSPLDNAYIVSTKENQAKYSRILKKHPYFKVLEPEAIFDGVLRQELRFSKHLLN